MQTEFEDEQLSEERIMSSKHEKMVSAFWLRIRFQAVKKNIQMQDQLSSSQHHI